METIIRVLTGGRDDVLFYREAASIIHSGGLVAFPTETVYGLGGDGLDPAAAKRIYEAKGRPSDNPLILHIAAVSQLKPLVKEIPETARKLMDAFWPGPLTMILEKSDLVPRETTGGLSTVALRMPDHPVARAFLKAADCPIAAPRANLSGRPSPTNARDVWEDLNGRIPLILDGGEARIGLESTIVDLSTPVPMLLRPGYYGLPQLRSVLGTVAVDPAVFGMLPDTEHPRAPGMKYRHYAPKVPLILVEGEDEARAAVIRRLAEKGRRTAVLISEETMPRYQDAPDLLLIRMGTRQEPEGIARRLFTTLRSLDRLPLDLVYSETFEEGQIGEAVMNRLRKAAGFHIIQAGKGEDADV